MAKSDAISSLLEDGRLLYLPDIPKKGEQARVPAAERRYQAWRNAVDKWVAKPRRAPARRSDPAPDGD